ncbi:hypothetical protein [Nocardiopsis metallicus]|uniref:vWA-MoxR associated protein middle region 0 domain-containing protein n=1 Tax=Nocardiopsis metallicus TaxID=179819 RepID=A0A840WRI7_9ACTN|nr:hypothetical protein [Nocardiopsis metallicus]MBB5494266.1 hypothetical protein [Nocardiopsis metallicus]
MSEGAPEGLPVGHELPPELRSRIVEALCEIDNLAEERGQATLLRYLSTRTRNRVRTGAAEVFAESMVDHCARNYSFLELSRWLPARESGSRPALAVVELLRPFVAAEENETLAHQLPGSTWPDLDEVRQQLSRIPCEGRIRAVYEQVRGGLVAQGRLPAPNTAWEALVALADFTARDGVPPVLIMCTQLSRDHPGLSCAALLSAWGEPTRWRPPLDPPASVDGPARLIVWVSSGARRDRYELESWAVLRQRGDGLPEFWAHWVDRDVASGEIARRVGERLDLVEEEARILRHPGLRVELVVGLDLMSALRVESWQNEGAGDRPALGDRAELVYRAAEVTDHRFEAVGKIRQLTRERWESLEQRGNANVVDLFHAGDMDEILLHRRLGNEDIICLSVPSGLKHPVKHVLRALGVGVPVVVWHCGEREGSIGDWLNPVRLEGEVTLTAKQVYGLPKVLFDCRTGAGSTEASVYIENPSDVAMMFHDQQPVRPPRPSQISPDSIL